MILDVSNFIELRIGWEGTRKFHPNSRGEEEGSKNWPKTPHVICERLLTSDDAELFALVTFNQKEVTFKRGGTLVHHLLVNRHQKGMV